MGKKGNVKVKVKSKKKPVKPTLSKGSGGLLSARIVATIKNEKKDG